jgi:diguanylate cyclase (GGDEF)-like protein
MSPHRDFKYRSRSELRTPAVAPPMYRPYAPRSADEAVERALHELAHLLSSEELSHQALAALEALRKAWLRAQRGAQTDLLTQLPNRAHFEHALYAATLQPSGSTHPSSAPEQDTGGTNVALMFLDLDGFKTVNDQLGHRAGDLLLKAVARRLVASVRDGDLVARYGGDEFVVLLQGPATMELATVLAERIVENVSTAYSLDGVTFELSISVGVATYPEQARDTAELLEHADLAMYCAKRRGGRQHALYDESFARHHDESGLIPLGPEPTHSSGS